MDRLKLLSPKRLIQKVSEHPAVWDKTSEDYKDRSLKDVAWCDICTFINENYNSMQPEEKEEFTRAVMKKWIHIRDAWVKSMKYGYHPITKVPSKPYIYHDDMKFMQKILKCKPRRNDHNKYRLSNRHFEEFYREKNETQYSNAGSQEVDNNKIRIENEADGDFSIENFKQEPIANNNETGITMLNKTVDLDESDEWPLEDSETMSAVEEQKLKEAERGKTKRRSRFVGSNTDDECEGSNVETVERRRRSHHRYDHSLYENRHWNFFMGILPSVNGLDDDHVLDFQSGVISLLQKLRKSQKQRPNNSSLNGRGRQHKASLYDKKLAADNINSRRKAKKNMSDPIAPEEEEYEEFGSDMEYLTDN